MNEPSLSIPRLAKHFGVSRACAFNAVSSGRIPAFRIGELWRVRLSDVPADIAEKWARPKPEKLPKGEYVYFIASADGPVKIGLSTDPDARLKRLNTSSPVRLELVAVLAGGADAEQQYHRRFAAHRLHGEWFERHPDILSEIERLKEAANA